MNLASSRRGFLMLAGAGAAVALAGCGSGSVVSAIKPKRFYVVGDGFSDVGQTGAVATVNDGSLIWIQQLAARYDLTVAPAASGGTGYAQVYARIDSPDTTSGTNVPLAMVLAISDKSPCVTAPMAAVASDIANTTMISASAMA